jgi:hypothetical protein
MSPRRIKGRASGYARLYQAGGDQLFPGQHQHQHDHDYDQTGINSLFQGRGPGRILILTGMVVAGFGFIGWASMIFGFFNFAPGHAPEGADGPAAMLGRALPSGIPVAAVYFLGSGAGAIMMKIGSSMAKAAANGVGTLGHLFATVAIIAVAVFALTLILAGAPVEILMPHFAH